MQRQHPLSVEYINKRLRVEPENGIAYWVDPTKHHRHLLGKPAGCLTPGRAGKDYWVIRMGGKGYKRSHIIFAVATGAWPTDQIDHIDGNSLNDKASNLRQCSRTQNMWNMKFKPKPSGLPRGVRRRGSMYIARIRVGGTPETIGKFETAEQAGSAYARERALRCGEFA